MKTAEQNFDWLDRQVDGLLNDFEGGESTKEETKNSFYEIIFDKLVKQIQDQQDYKQSIIGLIDEMMKERKDSDVLWEYSTNNGYIKALTELKQKIEAL